MFTILFSLFFISGDQLRPKCTLTTTLPTDYQLYLGARPRITVSGGATFRFAGTVLNPTLGFGSSLTPEQEECLRTKCTPCVQPSRTTSGIAVSYSLSGHQSTFQAENSSSTTDLAFQDLLSTLVYINNVTYFNQIDSANNLTYTINPRVAQCPTRRQVVQLVTPGP